LANNVGGLVELLASPTAKDAPATKAQAALWLLSYVNAGEARRDEAFKAGAVDACARAAAGADEPAAAAALSLLAAFARGPPQHREAVAGARPAPLATLHGALAGGGSSCAAAAAGAPRGVQLGCNPVPHVHKQSGASSHEMKARAPPLSAARKQSPFNAALATADLLLALAEAPETRPRVHRAALSWDLQPLLAALDITQKLPLMGGRAAAASSAAAIDLLAAGPAAPASGEAGGGGEASPADAAAAEALQRALVAAGGLAALVQVRRLAGGAARAHQQPVVSSQGA
jgi:hypothetical protein